MPLRTIGLPKQFLDHGKPADVRAAAGLNPAAIAERALIRPDDEDLRAGPGGGTCDGRTERMR